MKFFCDCKWRYFEGHRKIWRTLTHSLKERTSKRLLPHLTAFSKKELKENRCNRSSTQTYPANWVWSNVLGEVVLKWTGQEILSC